MLINQSNNLDFLSHETTKRHVDIKWNIQPILWYYIHVFLYFIFVLSFSQNIEIYKQKEEAGEIIEYKKTKYVSFFIILYFTFFEYFQLWDSFKEAKFLLYIFSSKNLFELFSFPFCMTTLLLENSELKSSYYSIAILLSYWIFIMRLDKFVFIGKYVNVSGRIIKKSGFLLILVFINLLGFVFSFRNRNNYYFKSKNQSSNANDSKKKDSDYKKMTHFNGSFSNSVFKSLEFFVGGLNIENMGIEELNLYSLVNFIIYGCFIFIMTILFINIFTGISIDEVQKLIQHAEAEIVSRKIDYILKLKSIKSRYKEIFSIKFLKTKFKNFRCWIKEIFIKIKNAIHKKTIIRIFTIWVIKKKDNLVKYIKDCWTNYKNNKNREKKKNEKKNSIETIHNELDKLKIEINELKMIVQSNSESINRNIKTVDKNIDRIEKFLNLTI